jgi:hypothetical protein
VFLGGGSSHVLIHLSRHDHLIALVDDASVDFDAGLVGLRIPGQSFAEQREPCFCVAKLLWQCVLSVPKEGDLWIYRLDSEARHAPNSVRDLELTEEYEITEDILARAGGRIELRRDGYLSKDRKLCTNLLVLAKSHRAPSCPEEEGDHWSREGELWSLRREFRTQ